MIFFFFYENAQRVVGLIPDGECPWEIELQVLSNEIFEIKDRLLLPLLRLEMASFGFTPKAVL